MKLSIITPCYNSSKFIHRLFQSLQSQTYKNFEWIVVEDFSKDNTRDLLREFKNNANFEMILLENETNKMINFNLDLAIQNITGDFVTFIGHDDAFVESAFETFIADWNCLTDELKIYLAGIVYNTKDQNGNLIGSAFKNTRVISDDFQMRFKDKIKGEKSSFQKSKILKQYKFSYPEIDIYVPENIVWFDIASKYKFMYINNELRIYYINQENHQSITNSIDDLKFQKGTYFYYKHLINNHGDRIKEISVFEYFKQIFHSYRYGKLLGKNFNQITKDLGSYFFVLCAALIKKLHIKY